MVDSWFSFCSDCPSRNRRIPKKKAVKLAIDHIQATKHKLTVIKPLFESAHAMMVCVCRDQEVQADLDQLLHILFQANKERSVIVVSELQKA